MINDAPIQDKMDSVTWSHWFASVASSISGEWYSSNAIPSVSGGLESPNNCYIYINPQSVIISAKFENGVSVGGIFNLAFSVFPSVLTLVLSVSMPLPTLPLPPLLPFRSISLHPLLLHPLSLSLCSENFHL